MKQQYDFTLILSSGTFIHETICSYNQGFRGYPAKSGGRSRKTAIEAGDLIVHDS